MLSDSLRGFLRYVIYNLLFMSLSNGSNITEVDPAFCRIGKTYFRRAIWNRVLHTVYVFNGLAIFCLDWDRMPRTSKWSMCSFFLEIICIAWITWTSSRLAISSLHNHNCFRYYLCFCKHVVLLLESELTLVP